MRIFEECRGRGSRKVHGNSGLLQRDVRVCWIFRNPFVYLVKTLPFSWAEKHWGSSARGVPTIPRLHCPCLRHRGKDLHRFWRGSRIAELSYTAFARRSYDRVWGTIRMDSLQLPTSTLKRCSAHLGQDDCIEGLLCLQPPCLGYHVQLGVPDERSAQAAVDDQGPTHDAGHEEHNLCTITPWATAVAR